MSAALHAQLAAIMEVLANAAVAEICELVDGGYSLLQLEISRSRKENEALRRKLRLVELRAARATALRAAVAASGAALPHARGRARAQPPARHQGNDPRGNRAPAGEVVVSGGAPQEALPDSGQDTAPVTPAAVESVVLTMAVIKVEDDSDDESWSQSEQSTVFCRVVEEQKTETEPLHPLTEQEAAGEGPNTPNTSRGLEAGSYECLMYEPQLQHGPRATQNPPRENPGCSYVLNTSELSVSDSGSSSSFTFNASETSPSAAELQQPAVFIDNQQRAPLATDKPQQPVRTEVTERRAAFIRRDRWRHQGRVSRVAVQSGEDGGGKSFVCNCCGKTLACLKNLKTHMRVHTGEKPFVCSLCGKRFSDSSNLKRHQSVHTGEKRYGCVHCGKRFAQSGSLKVHMTVHTDCKQFRCLYCGKTFISGSHLRRHITVHAGDKRGPPTLQGQ
ncbi:zinc finger protein 324B-like [Hippoglossus stenolepis]|uniref:zinc finger protein 324B-like n=1 Tax=Hippoglossus stenolepis TaxID=195615 RepID=UPI001813D4D1|nr:zinc finger protein 324B-like [Hippoglossus stenolepis]